MSNPLDWPARRPGAALLFAVVMTAAALVLILRLRPETSLQGLLDESDPAVVAMGRVLDNYPVINELLVLVTLPDTVPGEDPALLLAFGERLRVAVISDSPARELVAELRYRAEPRTREFVETVIVPNGLYYLRDDQIDEVMQRLTREGMAAQLARNQSLLSQPGPAAGGLAKALTKDPLRLYEFLTPRLADLAIPGVMSNIETGGAFLSPDRRSLLIRVAGTHSPSDFKFAKRLADTVQRLADAANHDHLRIDIAGAYAIAAHSATKIQADSISDIVSTVLGLVVLFVLACRRPVRLFLFAFLPVAAGLLWGFGAYALFRHKITPLAAVVGGTLGGIGLDYTIHYITHYQQMRRAAAGAAEAVWRTSREIFLPSLAAWVTSVIGFAAVAISPVRVLRDFAILGTLCLIGAWVATLLVLPAMLAKFGTANISPFAVRFDVADRVGAWIGRHARGLLVVCGVVMIVTAGCLGVFGIRFELNSDPMALHPQPSPPLEAQRFIARRMQVAAGALIVHLKAASPAELVSLSHAVQQRLDAAPVRSAGVTGVFGLASLIPDPAVAARRKAALSPDMPNRAVGDLRAALAESNFRPEAYEGYFPFLRKLVAPGAPPDTAVLARYRELAQLLLPRGTLDGAPPTQAVTLLFTSAPLETREAREAALGAVRNAFNGLPGATVTGTAVIGHDLETATHRDLPRFVAVALACILLYLLVHLRSIKLAALALLPIAISILCVVAFVSLAGVKLNIVHAVAAPLLLGINLDYGIFAVHAWRSAADDKRLAHHFPPAFWGLVICGGSTLIGFGSLVITSIPAVESLGWIINIGVGTSVLSTLLVLWPVLILARRRASGGLRSA